MTSDFTLHSKLVTDMLSGGGLLWGCEIANVTDLENIDSAVVLQAC